MKVCILSTVSSGFTLWQFCMRRATNALRSLSSLEELDLSETGIDDLGLQNLCKLMKLNTLNVSYTGGLLASSS